MKPLLKWAGGKAKLAAKIDKVFGGPCEGTYYEPFCGAASVFLYRRAAGRVERAVLSDANRRLINFYTVVRDDPVGLLAECDALPDLSSDRWLDEYYAVRDAFNGADRNLGVGQAARMFWLNRTCFNGLYRENASGGFNVPVGSFKRPRLPGRQHILRVSELLQGVELVCGDFDAHLLAAGPGDQVYCDPPYVPLSTTSKFTRYSLGDFGPPEQSRLAELAAEAGERGAQVVLSNHDTPVVRNELYTQARGFECAHRLKVRRSISAKTGTRGLAGELIIRVGPT